MNEAKEKLINLIEQFHALGEQALIDIDDDDDCDLNDKMIKVACAMEEVSIDVFGKKINMDFGMTNAVYHNKDEVIQSIRDYKK